MPPRIEPRLREFAETMRRQPTPFERTIWRQLSASRLDGLKFRRQSVFDDVIVDFYCPMARLIVEIDGQTHDPDRDAVRDARFAARGLLVLRFSNQHIAENLDGVLRTIIDVAGPRRRHAPTPSPSLEREGSSDLPPYLSSEGLGAGASKQEQIP